LGFRVRYRMVYERLLLRHAAGGHSGHVAAYGRDPR
jgi:hypothetical protein